ncbi:GerAB/ArcD/ProY family transporter [Clostridium sp. ZS2-4]|uniref:GerAB/ArcD/ProY family transporter n=1 Tax=Clostridium sp. ZS2-4 TaxID=2987703 RepID=UPI00227AE766|nr:endospore germination permease [Clostridium sp. ZS2-4]MCY6355640.1 endospore germination permease [Clostridium sp. ZS2-4]
MSNESVSDKQGIATIVLFLIGTSSMKVMGIEAGKDMWLAILLAILMALPMILIYGELHYMFPGKDLFDIFEICFGKVIGKGIIALYTWYLFQDGAIILRNVCQFINITTLEATPLIVIETCIGILCMYMVKTGIETIGKSAEFFLPILLIPMFITIVLLTKYMDINRILPVLYNGIKPIIKAAYLEFTFPFGEMIAFAVFFSHFTDKSSYKVYILGLLIGGSIVFITSLTIGLTLGIGTAKIIYYPAYGAISLINIREFLTRLELIGAIVFTIGGIFKVSVHLLVTCKGIAKIFQCMEYKFVITPISLLMSILSYTVYDSPMEFWEWDAKVWVYYIIPFQIIFPIITIIIAKINNKSSEINLK